MRDLAEKRVSRRTLLQFMGTGMAGIAGSSLLAACVQPGASSGDAAGGAAGETVSIVFGSYTWAEFTPMLDSIVAAFQAAHPTISVEKQFADWTNYWQKNQTQIAAGTPPDVGIMSIAYIGQYGTQGVLLDLDPYLETNSVDTSQYWPIAEYTWQMEPGQRMVGQGPHLGLPLTLANESCLVYNKSMFDNAGIALPTDEWTWDDALAAAQALTKDTGDPQTTEWGIASITPRDRLWPRIWDFGGAILDDAYTKCLLDQPEAMAAMQWLYDTYAVHKVNPQTPPTHAVHPFLTGRIGMYGCGSWVPSSLKDAEFEWEVAHWPRGEQSKERITQGNSDGFSCFKATKAPDAAWELLYFMTGPDQPGTQQWSTIFSSIPATKALAASDAFLKQSGLPASYHIIVEDLEFSQSKHNGVKWAEWVDAQEQALGGAWTAQVSLEEAVTKAVQDIDTILNSIA